MLSCLLWLSFQSTAHPIILPSLYLQAAREMERRDRKTKFALSDRLQDAERQVDSMIRQLRAIRFQVR